MIRCRRQPVEHIRSLRSTIAMLRKRDLSEIPPLPQLRPPITFLMLQNILKRSLIQFWDHEPITADFWDVVARMVYCSSFRQEARAVPLGIAGFLYRWLLARPAAFVGRLLGWMVFLLGSSAASTGERLRSLVIDPAWTKVALWLFVCVVAGAGILLLNRYFVLDLVLWSPIVRFALIGGWLGMTLGGTLGVWVNREQGAVFGVFLLGGLGLCLGLLIGAMLGYGADYWLNLTGIP